MDAMMLFYMTVMYGGVVLLTGALLFWLPSITRPELYFAVTVPSAFRKSEGGRRILGSYRLRTAVCSLAALALVAASGVHGSIWLLTGALVVQDGGSILAYLAARARVRPHGVAPSMVREASLAVRPVRLPGGPWLNIGPFMVLAAAAVYLNMHWNDLPERFPIHWGIDGQPNGWASRSLAGVYGPLITGALVSAFLALLGYGVSRWTRPVSAIGEAGAAESRFRRVVAGVLLSVEYLIAATFVWTAVLPLRSNPGTSPNVATILVITLLVVGVVAVVMIREGQGGSRRLRAQSAGQEATRNAQPIGDRTLDEYWKAGVFYVTPRIRPSLSRNASA